MQTILTDLMRYAYANQPDQIPNSSVGKLNKMKLRELHAERQPHRPAGARYLDRPQPFELSGGPDMKVIMQALADQHEELDALLGGFEECDWERDVSDCPGWTVGDVVLHLAQTDELVPAAQMYGFTAAAERLTGRPRDSGIVDDLIAQMVAHEHGAPAAELLARWRAASAAVRDLLVDCDPRHLLPWVVTDLPARTLATTRLSECWIHTRDVARAVGAEASATDRLWHIARLAWRSIPYAYARAGLDPPSGPVTVSLAAPDGGTWDFGAGAGTAITGNALDFCLVAARRLDPAAADLRADGPGGLGVLALLRTYG